MSLSAPLHWQPCFDGGFADWGYLQIEVDYEAIRLLPEFQSLIAGMMKGRGK